MSHTKSQENDELTCDEKIVFVMDALKSGAKKRKISKARPLSFGAHMDPAKIRALRPPFHVTWRMRLTHHRVLSPVRPVLLHAQEVQVTPGVLRLF
ncbi:unnamed protein product [Symbiodinium necroappetens]|uniref:Uncharacterized protein n=1 Tax=Symbiodinium necroappetens TaxID=1628268 RepID=A0A813AI92_9DINO|nr:unnamed protein product [Symbiodinium necroappetens]